MLIVVVVDYVVFVLSDDVHCTQNVKCVIYTALDILKVDFLANLRNVKML